jgi:hypothetical protein
MQPTIIVLQTAYSAFMMCRGLLQNMGLKEGHDFMLLDEEPEEHLFTAGTRQLFITGSFCGCDEGVAEMVQAARDRNPELVTVSFASHEIDGPFDQQVRKRIGMSGQFRKIIEDFQNGTLVRTETNWKPKETGSYVGL